jgi:hypothetical protein
MTTDWSVPAWVAVAAAVVVVVLLLLALLAGRGRSRAARRADEAERATAELRARVEELERRLESRPPAAPAGRPEREYVITSLGEQRVPEGAPVPALPAPAFADAVLRETVLHTASLLHGVRRALSPEVRNRIRFEMRRELKRSRKARRTEVREALREYRARHRADVPEGDVA